MNLYSHETTSCILTTTTDYFSNKSVLIFINIQMSDEHMNNSL